MKEKREKTREAKAQLHKIDGFYPESELVEIPVYDEFGNEKEKKHYLPLATKETWFWLVYPEGKIQNKILHLDENYVRCECKLYRHYKDAEEEYFVSAEKFLTIRYDDPFYEGRSKEEIVGGFLNAAKAGAESIALSKGGFGIQIESPEESDLLSDLDYEKSVKRIPLPKILEDKEELDKKLKETKQTPFVPYEPTEGKVERQSIPIPTAISSVPEEIKDDVTEIKEEIKENAVENKEETSMTMEEAKNVVSTSKNAKFTGKTLGEIFNESPMALPYIAVNSTGIERQAAILLSESTDETKAKLQQYFDRG